MELGHSEFKHGSVETGETLPKGCFYVVVSQRNSGNEIVEWYFYLKSNNCVEFCVFNVFS